MTFRSVGIALRNISIPLSVGVASVSVISFQLVIMQILSITQWHHFAYMVISMAMLGFGAAGTVLALFREWMKSHFEVLLPVLYLLSGISMAGTAWMVGIFGDFDAFLLFFERAQIGLMVFSYLIYCLPFFFSGLAITLVFYCKVDEISKLYFFNLAGSAAGALFVILLFWILPLGYVASVLALLPLTAAWLVRPDSLPVRSLTIAGLLFPAAGLLFPVTPETSEYKAIYAARQLPDAEIVHETSSPYGLLQVVSAPAQRFAPALSLQHRGEPPVRDVMFNNGEYFGTLLGILDPEDGPHILDYTTRGLPFALRDQKSMLVLKAGTGTDVSQGVYHDVEQITVVEPHRQSNRLLIRDHPEWIDSLYRHPAVNVYGNSVRTWLAGSDKQKMDLVVLPVLGAFGGTSGVHALQEQYHLTHEAFEAYWEQLAPDGMISVTAWDEHPPRTSLKLLATWRSMLDTHGKDEPADHIMAVRNWGTITFLMSRSPFTSAERDKAREFSRDRSFDPLVMSDIRAEERERFNETEDPGFFDYVDTLVFGKPERFLEGYTFDISPATDNRPFFSHFMTLESIPELREMYGDDQIPYMELGFVMAWATLVQIVVASIVLIILPLFRVGWKGTRRRWTFLYFSGIGTGFMFFEMVLIQKLVLYLGQPVYATAAVLAALLLFSGIGSRFSSRLPANRTALVRTGLTVVALIVLYTFLLMPLLSVTMSWPVFGKVLTVALLLAPPAFFMGMMFPFGLRRLSGSNDTQIPWACGIDSCLSVSATALATVVALGSGFGLVMGIAAAAYGLTTLAALRMGE
ncbi:hypothetical protein [Natronogracilivirga saccharolytica]|uniref:Spermidine synthase-like protein n=1 Tax=Natronogracilivirga saccharolytica TaxID=2812953 RepID=A0A8J7RUM8_9BACT|nr:hypothetical protein [Natronogracilivirga saccharolytica]MBP3193272.1 hypothetical protein [Natronogracilivirga saccharolytica]